MFWDAELRRHRKDSRSKIKVLGYPTAHGRRSRKLPLLDGLAVWTDLGQDWKVWGSPGFPSFLNAWLRSLGFILQATKTHILFLTSYWVQGEEWVLQMKELFIFEETVQDHVFIKLEVHLSIWEKWGFEKPVIVIIIMAIYWVFPICHTLC